MYNIGDTKKKSDLVWLFADLQGFHSAWKNGRHFPVREKSGKFEQTEKVRENHTKYWKSPGISDKCYF